MELKHKECFCPAVIKHMGCQPVSKAAREVWEFVNLYSTNRGCNRFIALLHFRDHLKSRREVLARGFRVPELCGLGRWIKRESRLGLPALREEVDKTRDPDLCRVLDWCLEVNERVADMVTRADPFPGARDVLVRTEGKADMIVVSQTPLEALTREWKESGLDRFVGMIAGQEHGTKTEHLRNAAGGKGYGAFRILKVGDAPGDLKAAKENDALFFPIVPGKEEVSWDRLASEGLDRFFGETFAGKYQQRLVEEFEAALPVNPSWTKEPGR